jgi:hypothetical protein
MIMRLSIEEVEKRNIDPDVLSLGIASHGPQVILV